MQKDKDYRYFTLCKLNNKEIEFGRVKISSSSGKPIDAAKKLLKSICDYQDLTKNNKLKCKALFYIRETTKGSNKRIYGPYKGSFKKYEKPAILKLDNGKIIKHTMYPFVVKIKNQNKTIQKGGVKLIKVLEGHTYIVTCILELKDGRLLSGSYDNTLKLWNKDTGDCISTLEEHDDPVTCSLELSDGRLLSGSDDKNIFIHN